MLGLDFTRRFEGALLLLWQKAIFYFTEELLHRPGRDEPAVKDVAEHAEPGC